MASTSFLQRTAADVQNTATSAANQNNQLATHVDSQLDHIEALILGPQKIAHVNFERIHSNIYELYKRVRAWNMAYERHFASIQERLGQLDLRPLMPQPERPQVLVKQLGAIAGPYLGATAPSSPPSHQICHAEPSTPTRRQQPDNDDAMIAGKAPLVTGVPLTYERTVGKWRTVRNKIDNSQESRTGINACSIRTKL